MEKLIELKHLMERIEIICNAGREINPNGETWQDMAYSKALTARKLIESIIGEALDKVLK